MPPNGMRACHASAPVRHGICATAYTIRVAAVTTQNAGRTGRCRRMPAITTRPAESCRTAALQADQW